MTERRPYRVDGALLRGDAGILALFVVDLVIGLAVRPHLPGRVPMHWNASGKVDGWGSPWEAILLPPGVALFVYAVLLLIPLIDPRRAAYAFFGGTLRVFRGVLVAFILGVHVLTLVQPLGVPVSMDRVARLGIPLLFVALGNRFGRIRPNWFVGIRVPWTLESEEVWRRTHRMAGRLWVIAGLLLLPAVFLPPRPGLVVLSVVLGIAAVVPIAYSFLLYRRLNAAR